MYRLPLFPVTARVDPKGHLVIGGCDVVELAARFGTPLYVFDETGLREKCAEFKREFQQRYPATTVLYAAKAFMNKGLAVLINEEGLGLDVVSIGEIGIVRSAGFPLEKAYFHGNNKSADEIRQSLQWGIGHIVVDNFHELGLLNGIAGELGLRPKILLRLTPGIDPHTHKYMTTGQVDSKFGFPVTSTEEAIARAVSSRYVDFVGVHFHLGSQILEVDPYPQAVEVILNMVAGLKQKYGFELKELDVGGGFGIQYMLDTPAPPVAAFAGAIAAGVKSKCSQLGLPLPQLVIEPGRSIVARSGVALYTVGAIKDIPGVRRYVSVDGGMGDNIRPALYGSRHEAAVAGRMTDRDTETVTIAGKFCESGDILIRDIMLPTIAPGDILAVPGCGAYCIPQSSNYNAFFKPPIVLVRDGRSRLIHRRETVADLTSCDIV